MGARGWFRGKARPYREVWFEPRFTPRPAAVWSDAAHGSRSAKLGVRPCRLSICAAANFLAASETISRRAGVTQQQYQALLVIKTWAGRSMTMKDLADQLLLGLTTPGVCPAHEPPDNGAPRRAHAIDRRSPERGISRPHCRRRRSSSPSWGARHLREMLRQGADAGVEGACATPRAISPTREGGETLMPSAREENCPEPSSNSPQARFFRNSDGSEYGASDGEPTAPRACRRRR